MEQSTIIYWLLREHVLLSPKGRVTAVEPLIVVGGFWTNITRGSTQFSNKEPCLILPAYFINYLTILYLSCTHPFEQEFD